MSGLDVSSRVAKVVWALLLIWTGAALLLHLSWGAGLVGAGAILLAGQALRRYLRAGIEGFGLVVGLLLVVCGAWNVFGVTLDLVPFLCIGAGIALLVSLSTAKGEHRAPGEPPGLHAHPERRA